MKYKYFLLIALVIIAGILQSTDMLDLYGVKPNLSLVVLISASLFISDILIYLSLILVSMIMLSFQGGFEFEQVALGFLSVAAFFAGRNLHWQPLLINLSLIGIATIVFYLFMSPTFLFNNLILVFGEVIYNLAFGTIFFKIFEKWPMNSMLKT